MASEATMEAAARESRANAREDAVTITSGAKEKVDRNVASVQGLAEKIAHPMDADARKRADEKTDLRKAEASAKQAAIRQTAHQEAEKERFAARSQVAQLVSQGQGGNRYAELPPPPPVGADYTCATAAEVFRPIESPPVHAAPEVFRPIESPPVHAAPEVFRPIESLPVHATPATGLGNTTNSDYHYPPVPRPLPLPPQSLDSTVVAATADVAVDSNPSMSANEVPAQRNNSSVVTSNTDVGK